MTEIDSELDRKLNPPHDGHHAHDLDTRVAELSEFYMPLASAILRQCIRIPADYVDLPVEQWEQLLVERIGLPEYLAHHLAEVARDHQKGVFNAETDVVERVTGRPPVSLEEFVREARLLFIDGGVQVAPAA